MGDDERALVRLWREKRGEIEPEDLSGDLVVRLGAVTEELNRRWFECNTDQVMCFSAAAASEKAHGSMNLASNTAPVASTMPSRVAAM